MTNAKSDILKRIYLLYFIVFLFASMIIGKIFYIQFVEGAELKKKAKDAPMRIVEREVQRGNIYADDGVSILVTSVPYFEVRMDVASPEISDEFFNANIDSLSRKLSGLFRVQSSKEYMKALSKARKKGSRYFFIAKNVSYDTLKILKTFPIFNSGRFKSGLIINEQVCRKLIYGNLALRTIGYERNNITVGLEGYYSNELSGVKAKQVEQMTKEKEWRPIGKAEESETHNGYDIVTTIDAKIQDVAENALRICLDSNKAQHGCAVLMEVKTGYVKAIANLTKIGEHRYEERYNYAIGEKVEPGSTFKLMSLIAAMVEGVDTSVTVDITGASTMYNNRKMEDSHNLGLGRISMVKAFEISSNVGISKIITQKFNRADKSSCKKFTDRLYEMGLNEPLGLKIVGEAHPVVKNPDFRSWSNITLPWMSIGYEVALTPLQILAFYNAVANDGVKVCPQFVQEIRSNGKLIEKFDPVILNPSMCSKETVAKAKHLLECVVQNGTAKKLKNPLYKIAGKTGTAQIAQDNKGFNKKNYRASFVGYFPADNPMYSIIVIIHDPQGGKYYGGEVAAPVFKEIANKVFATKLNMQNVPVGSDTVSRQFVSTGNSSDYSLVLKSLGIPVNNLNADNKWISLAVSTNAAKNQCSANPVEVRQISNSVVPDVTGMNLKDAVYLLENSGLKVKINGKGIIRKQSIAPGAKVAKNTPIQLDLSI